jgi:hypothetical protein
MKRTIFYGAIIIVIGVCLFLVFSKHERQVAQTPEMQPTNSSQITNQLKPSQSVLITPPPKSAPRQPVQAINPATNESTQQRLQSLSNAVQNWSAQVHGQIQFYGKVVDENNQPIEGAGVQFVWAHVWPLPEGTPSTNVISDQEGLFSLSGIIGSSLGVHVSKEGYYDVRSLDNDNFNYSSLPGMTPFQPDSNNPVIFHLRKRGAGADLISAALNVKISRDGTPTYVDFLNKTSGAIGQMQLSQMKPSYETWKQATEWSFSMTIPDGGFIEENDEFPFEAPESGYQPKLQFDFKVGQPDWETHFTKSYYFIFGNPPRYGQLTVETEIISGGARIIYAINPDGSRYLEPK